MFNIFHLMEMQLSNTVTFSVPQGKKMHKTTASTDHGSVKCECGAYVMTADALRKHMETDRHKRWMNWDE